MIHDTAKAPETPDFTQSVRKVRILTEIIKRTENKKITTEEKETVNLEKNMERKDPTIIQGEMAKEVEKKNQDGDQKGRILLTEILQQVRKYPLNTLTEYKSFRCCVNANSFIR